MTQPSGPPPSLRRFVRRAAEGMQRPPIFEADDGHEYVLKLDTLDRDFPAAELVGAYLAAALGVPQPPFAVLDVPEVLAEAFAASEDPDLTEFAESFQRLGLCCFGSRYLPGVVQKWTPRLRSRVDDCDPVLVRLLVLDAFIENGDRSAATNPNLLVCNRRLYAIDHGQALPAVQGILGKKLPYAFDSHLAWSVLQERPHLLDAPVADLRALSDGAIEAAVAAVPVAWWFEPHRPAAVVADLRSRRDALPATLDQLRERLS